MVPPTSRPVPAACISDNQIRLPNITSVIFGALVDPLVVARQKRS